MSLHQGRFANIFIQKFGVVSSDSIHAILTFYIESKITMVLVYEVHVAEFRMYCIRPNAEVDASTCVPITYLAQSMAPLYRTNYRVARPSHVQYGAFVSSILNNVCILNPRDLSNDL